MSVQKRSACVLIFLAVATASCQPAKDTKEGGPVQPQNPVTGHLDEAIKELWTIPIPGDPDEARLVGPSHLAVHDRSLYVADGKPGMIRIYDIESGKFDHLFQTDTGKPWTSALWLKGVGFDVHGGMWAMDLGEFYLFSESGVLRRKFRNIMAALFEILPDGRLIAVGDAGPRTGGLMIMKGTGETVRVFSGRPEATSGTPTPWLYGSSQVVVVNNEIWQIYSDFNQIKVFSSNGDSLRTFEVDNDMLRARSRQNVENIMAATKSVYVIIPGVAHIGDEVWLVCDLRPYSAEGDQRTHRYLFRLNLSGHVISTYELGPAAGGTNDLLVWEDGGRIQFCIATVFGRVHAFELAVNVHHPGGSTEGQQEQSLESHNDQKER